MNNILPTINSEYQDAFIRACKENKLDVVILLISTVKIQQVDLLGGDDDNPTSALILACRCNNTSHSVVELLLRETHVLNIKT